MTEPPEPPTPPEPPFDLSVEIRAAHDAAIADGEAGYLDPETGLFVFTAAFLAERGTCCDSGCRHCPYGDLRAGEPRAR